jgi:hypothetical protein
MEVIGQHFPVTLAARKGQTMPIKQKVGWATEPGWTIIKKKKWSIAPVRNGTTILGFPCP